MITTITTTDNVQVSQSRWCSNEHHWSTSSKVGSHFQSLNRKGEDSWHTTYPVLPWRNRQQLEARSAFLSSVLIWKSWQCGRRKCRFHLSCLFNVSAFGLQVRGEEGRQADMIRNIYFVQSILERNRCLEFRIRRQGYVREQSYTKRKQYVLFEGQVKIIVNDVLLGKAKNVRDYYVKMDRIRMDRED